MTRSGTTGGIAAIGAIGAILSLLAPSPALAVSSALTAPHALTASSALTVSPALTASPVLTVSPALTASSALTASGSLLAQAELPSGAPPEARPGPPPGSSEADTSSAVDSTAWIDDPPAAAEEAPGPGGTVVAPAAADPARNPAAAGGAGSLPPPLARPGARPGPGPDADFESRPAGGARGILAKTATGVYGGYPSWAGAMIVAPADGRVAFRSGLTGLPNIGILWSPGIEVRLDEIPGTYAVEGTYVFSNLFLGRSYLNGERDYTGLETGVGYRWPMDDRRGKRWIAALEAGGYWRPESSWPFRPSIRFSWLLVD